MELFREEETGVQKLSETNVLTIVMPAYNEADHIERSVTEWWEHVVRIVPGATIIVVDDCSTDGTSRVLADIASRIPEVKIMRPEKNGGHGKAVRLGLDAADSEYIFHTDSDRQHDPRDFWKLWSLRDSSDFVFGVRSQRADGRFRLFVTRTMRLLNLVMWSEWIRDANCPFKLMRASALRRVLEKIPREAFIPMVMVAIVSRKMGFRVHEIEVSHFPRKGGQQSLKGLVKWLRVGSGCALELLQVRLTWRRAARIK